MLRWAGATTPAWFLSSHDIDLMCWFFDDTAEEVYATAVSQVLRSRGIDTPDAIQAQVRFRRGAVATFEACWTYPDTFPTMTDSFVELVLADGVIHLDRKREQIEIATHEAFSYPRNQLAGRVGGKPSGSVALAVQDFVDAVLDGAEPLVSLDSSVHVTEVLVAIDESWRTGVPVRLTVEEAP
jgi:predicted dehydrogenase